MYRQTQGLTIGDASSVQAANMVMYIFFQQFNKMNHNLIWDHYRFIDDLFGICKKTSEELLSYFHYLNKRLELVSCHSSSGVQFPCLTSQCRSLHVAAPE